MVKQLCTYPPVVVSALPSTVPGVLGPWLIGTVDVVSALAIVTSLALLTSSPQCGQKLWPFTTDAQGRWNRCEMLTSGWHSMKVPYSKVNILYFFISEYIYNKTLRAVLRRKKTSIICLSGYRFFEYTKHIKVMSLPLGRSNRSLGSTGVWSFLCDDPHTAPIAVPGLMASSSHTSALHSDTCSATEKENSVFLDWCKQKVLRHIMYTFIHMMEFTVQLINTFN